MTRKRRLMQWLRGDRRVQHVYQPELHGKCTRLHFRGNLVLYLVVWDNGKSDWCTRSQLRAETEVQLTLGV